MVHCARRMGPPPHKKNLQPTTPAPFLSLSLSLFFSLLTFGRWHWFFPSSWRDANLLFSFSFRCLIARFKHTDLLCISKWGKWRRGLIFGLAAFFRKENTPKYKADNLPYLQKAKSGKEPEIPQVSPPRVMRPIFTANNSSKYFCGRVPYRRTRGN